MEHIGFTLLGYEIFIKQGDAWSWIDLLDGAFEYQVIRSVALLALKHTEDTTGIGIMEFDGYRHTLSSREGIAMK